MTNHAERLREKRYSRNAVVAKLDRTLTRLPQALYVFLEGILDQAAYVEEISRRSADAQIVIMLCDGKAGVLEQLTYVREKYGLIPNAVFFVDRDLDDFIGSSRHDRYLYVTDGYSVENEFCSPSAFACLLQNVFCVEIGSEVFSDYVDRYDVASEAFSEILLPVMAWAILIKRLGCVVRLDNVSMSDIVMLDDNGIPKRRRKALDRFRGQADPNLSLINLYTVRAVIKEIKHLSLKTYVRGKFAVWFLVRFVDLVKREWRSRRPGGERALFIDITLDENNVVPLLASRLRRSPSLCAFLDQIIGTYNRWLRG